jgi:hypothetical protein
MTPFLFVQGVRKGGFGGRRGLLGQISRVAVRKFFVTPPGSLLFQHLNIIAYVLNWAS